MNETNLFEGDLQITEPVLQLCYTSFQLIYLSMTLFYKPGENSYIRQIYT